jgi:hypothetical protein
MKRSEYGAQNQLRSTGFDVAGKVDGDDACRRDDRDDFLPGLKREERRGNGTACELIEVGAGVR